MDHILERSRSRSLWYHLIGIQPWKTARKITVRVIRHWCSTMFFSVCSPGSYIWLTWTTAAPSPILIITGLSSSPPPPVKQCTTSSWLVGGWPVFSQLRAPSFRRHRSRRKSWTCRSVPRHAWLPWRGHRATWTHRKPCSQQMDGKKAEHVN